MRRSFLSLLIMVFAYMVLLSCAVSSVEKAQATTLIRQNFAQVIEGSELIFEGRVIYRETRLSPDSGKPFTYFTFQILDILKGSCSSPTIELGFMGGPKGEFVLTVSDMRMPEIGERGVYFVERVNAGQINPLYGWHQGHYLVVPNQQGIQDLVPPVEEADSMDRAVQSRSLSRQSLLLRNAPTLEQFKQGVVDAVRRNAQ